MQNLLPDRRQEMHDKLHDLLESEWQRSLREFPLMASELGEKRFNSSWPDLSVDGFQRRHRDNRRVIEQLAAIDCSRLSPEDRLHFTLFRKKYESAVEEFSFRCWLLPLTAREGIQDANAIADALVFDCVQDYEDWLRRLELFPKYMAQTIALMREGIKRDIVHPKVVMQRVPAQIRRQIVQSPEESLFFKPFRSFPPSIPEADRLRLIEQARRVIPNSVVPVYATLLTFFEGEYLPACRDSVGATDLPHGRELYEFFVRKFTTTDLSPEAIHDLGVREVRRIRGQMERIVEQAGFAGAFQEFLEYLRKDPAFYYPTADALFAAYHACCKRIDTQLPKLFRRLPRVWYDIQPVPMNMAPDTTTAYYRPLSADGKRPGTYFVNLYKPEVRPKYEIEALSLHEAIPGHHLQIALSMELENLPAFRRFAPEGEYTGFVEGWALYAESLGEELGCYGDPYSMFGRLTYEMWRAVRLVIDTGIHAFGWTRQQAINYFRENTAKTLHDIENEVDRYIAWPGQAVAYKIGELTIQRLRANAETALGTSFDVREFHEMLLDDGALPLDVLESKVEQWVAGKAKTPL